MDMLRSLNKSYPNESFSLFDGFGTQILGCLGSPKPSLVKNSLAFVYEILVQAGDIHPLIFERLLPQLLRLTQHTSKSFRTCSVQCVSQVYKCHANPTTLRIFAVQSVSQSGKPALSKFAFKCLIKGVHSLKERISEVDAQTFQVIFKAILWHLNHFKCKTRSSAERLCRYFFDLMGREHFKEYIKNLVDENVLSLFEANQFVNVAMSVEKKPGSARMSYRDFQSLNHQSMRLNKQRNKVQGPPDELCLPQQPRYF